MKDYQDLKLLLEKETYPHTFYFKFIGKNSPSFREAVQSLEDQFPELAIQTQRFSLNQNHICYSYFLDADSADEIINVYRVIAKLPDLSIVL